MRPSTSEASESPGQTWLLSGGDAVAGPTGTSPSTPRPTACKQPSYRQSPSLLAGGCGGQSCMAAPSRAPPGMGLPA